MGRDRALMTRAQTISSPRRLSSLTMQHHATWCNALQRESQLCGSKPTAHGGAQLVCGTRSIGKKRTQSNPAQNRVFTRASLDFAGFARFAGYKTNPLSFETSSQRPPQEPGKLLSRTDAIRDVRDSHG
jgi:hypothetical protein